VFIVGVVLFAVSPPVGAAAVAASVAAGVLLYRRGKRWLEELLNLVECDGRLKRPLLVVPGYIYFHYYVAGKIAELSITSSRAAPRSGLRLWTGDTPPVI